MEIILDKTLYPLIRIDNYQAYIHLLPVTKIQFERYISDPTAVSDATFYYDSLRENPRISPSQIKENNYWQAFMTALSPDAILRFATWLGSNYDIPSIEEWDHIYKLLNTLSLDEIYEQLESQNKLNSFFVTTFKQLRIVIRPTTATEAMLLDNGVLEWVKTSNRSQPWAALGMPNRKFQNLFSRPSMEYPAIPINLSLTNIYYFGFRLIYREG